MATKKTTTRKQTTKKAGTKQRSAKSAPRARAPKRTEKKLSQMDAALRVLTAQNEPMTCKQMVEVMAKKKLWKLLRMIEPGVNIKKAKSDIIRYVLSTPERVAVVKRMFEQARHAIAKRRREDGKARSTKRSLLASLMVCTNCRHSFVQRHDRRWPGPRGEGYRYYFDSGYHRGGKAVCKLTYLPADALDEFVLIAIKRIMLADHETTKQAIDAFVKSVMRPQKAAGVPKSAKRDLDLVNRKIKATLSMLADPTFDGLDELRNALADLKSKRDALQTRMKPEKPAKPQMSQQELRQWALQRFAEIDRLVANRTSELADRQLVEAYVERIEINPHEKTGVVVLHADLKDALALSSTRVPKGDFMGAHEWCFYGWCEGAGHQFFGPNNATDLWAVKKVNPQSMIHLTEKPVELAVRAIQYSSLSGENVLDLFSGSGSTLIGCQRTGRKAFLMELDPPYCDVIVERWCNLTGEEAFRVNAQRARTARSDSLASTSSRRKQEVTG